MSTTAAAVGEQVLGFTRELRWETVPHPVRRHVALALLDHVAVCEAGRTAPASLIAADYASEVHAGDRATALLDGRRLSAPGAAWANGVLANVLDYDDGHRITKGHPGAMVIPAALATAEAVNASATAFLEAVLVGYEVALRAGVLIHEREAQYHASASWGALGVAASVGRLLGLGDDELRHAIGIAEYHAPIALMPRAVNDPAMTKDTTGWGAFMGTSSAMLAARGFTGLDSEFMQASDDLDLGARWDVLELYLKPYPCCRWSQPGIDAALRLRADGLDPGAHRGDRGAHVRGGRGPLVAAAAHHGGDAVQPGLAGRDGAGPRPLRRRRGADGVRRRGGGAARGAHAARRSIRS